ncbi:MAG: hypothetical protein EON54_17815 [Alcaligenaceae bacterium]|nr:MAG: hypothetical protein EON54_17815 [Alcaligenaceae bacterium]
MAKDWSSQLSQVNFRCGRCKSAWTAVPDLIEEDSTAEHHPWRYYVNCTTCATEHQPQAGWERALLKAHVSATGPLTVQGKAASASNLDGHPTAEEALRTRFNAMEHGRAVRMAVHSAPCQTATRVLQALRRGSRLERRAVGMSVTLTPSLQTAWRSW